MVGKREEVKFREKSAILLYFFMKEKYLFPNKRKKIEKITIIILRKFIFTLNKLKEKKMDK